ncbi:MAG TPA: hypothetical protein VHL10_03470 [Nitrososphaera sp.]|jgi:hypothetical protein|nr:hypothetical protein [Nitrososphaera sp.]
MQAGMALTLSESRHASKSKAELADEIIRLKNELRSKNEEIMVLKKRLVLYKSIK